MTSCESTEDLETIVVPKPQGSFSNEALPYALGGIHPRELFQLALDNALPPGPSADWDPPEPGEIQRRFHEQKRPEYTIQAELGHGAMGAVYAAHHAGLDAAIAIKIMRPGSAFDDPQFVRGFEEEARTMHRLDHPGLVRVFDSGCLKDTGEESGGARLGDLFFFVMELLRGNDLRKELIKGLIPEDRVLSIFSQICAAVAAAHEKNIIHRDLKPENIFLSFGQGTPPAPETAQEGNGPTVPSPASTPVVKVLDFGLAFRVTPDDECHAHGAYQVAGTPPYMAPEQLREESRQPASKRTDVWALGVILYELITGTRPNRESWEVPSKLRGGLLFLDDVVRGCLEDNPDRRYQSALEVSEKVQSIIDAPQIARELEKQRSINRRLNIRLVVAVCFGIAALAAGIIAFQRQRTAERARQVSEQTRQSAETLIEDMLGDLRPQLEKAGRLDLLQTVAKSAYGYFQNLPSTEWNPATERKRAWMLKYYADVVRKGDGPDDAAAANDAYILHAELLKKLHDDYPEQSGLAREYAQAVGEVGMVWESRGKPKEAAASYNQALSLLNELASKDADPQVRIALAEAWENLGILELNAQEFANAEKAFGEQLKICQELSDNNRDDPDLQRNLAKSHGNLGDVWFTRPKSAQAGDQAVEDHYLMQQQLFGDLSANEPDDMRLFYELAIAWNKVGKGCQKQGDLEKAQVAFTQFHDKIRHLVREVDPEHPDYQRTLSASLSNLGDVAIERGALGLARERYEEDLELTKGLASRYAGDLSDQIVLGMSYANMAKLCWREGKPEEHTQFLKQAMAQRQWAQEMPSNHPMIVRLEEKIAEAQGRP